MPPLPTNHACLILFGRYPMVGATKTRLIPALGPAGAAALHKRLTENVVATARKLARPAGMRLVFCHAGGDAKRLRQWLGTDDIEFVLQAAGDLGQRMYMAVQGAFDQGARRVVLVGTDIPGLTADILERAVDALQDHDLVLGPSTDGGYWLVGMNSRYDIFDGMAWSRDDVLEKTIHRARIKGLRLHLLDSLTDLDTPADLRGEKRWVKPAVPYLSVIIPTLNEERQLARAITSAASVDSEIVVSDGGSRDRTVEIAHSLGVRIVQGQRGRASQQNRGAAAALGKVLLFLHADTRLPGNYVNHVFETLMDRRVAMGAFRFGVDSQKPAMRWIAFFTNRRADWLKLPYGDQALFMHRRDFHRAGGFPDVPIAEDLFLVRAMARQGRIALAPAAVVTSARRWQRLGIPRTTLINTIIAAGCVAGMAPDRLAPLYRPLNDKHESTQTPH